MGSIVLITGGVRSGKSALAEKLATRNSYVLYVATAEAEDAEMAERISLHQARRPVSWGTVVAPRDLITVARMNPDACLLIDCLGLWVTNCLLAAEAKNLAAPEGFIQEMRERTEALLDVLAARQGEAILVTNEVGLGLVPPYKMGRVFRDCLGYVNAAVAERARDVILCAVGIPITLKKEGVLRLG
ncbi:MAG: bifunctional adenosylcobinamide kinase/adenosylcobinamide-phosphate guanylyltransferase [Thermaerobacter sp.]|nr:bifunctional adenosylcobinamide kinase/adenosylcobinamide-phosphate guanylyltransferase [Thermaerobacter sp.]